MTLAFTVVLNIDNPEEARINDDIREEYRKELDHAIDRWASNTGFEGELIDKLELSVTNFTVVPSVHP